MMHLVELPSSVKGLMTKDVYEKARIYSLDKLNFSNFKDIYSKLFTTVWNFNFCNLNKVNCSVITQ